MKSTLIAETFLFAEAAEIIFLLGTFTEETIPYKGKFNILCYAYDKSL